VIVNPQTEAFGIIEPSGYQAPLIGRSFVYGVLDCYTLVLDYYQRELGITLPYYVRDDAYGWWERGQNLYAERFAEAGFMAVNTPQPGDVILMQVQSDVANHAAVYLGDGVILHHLVKQLSRRDQYGGYWQKHTAHILRHRSRCAGSAPLPNPLDETTSHSTKPQTTAAKSLVIPQAGEGTNAESGSPQC